MCDAPCSWRQEYELWRPFWRVRSADHYLAKRSKNKQFVERNRSFAGARRAIPRNHPHPSPRPMPPSPMTPRVSPMMLACSRDIARMDREVRSGTWSTREGARRVDR
jgi:hypothetical protein